MDSAQKSRVRRARLLDGLRRYSMPRTRECCRQRIAGAVAILRTPEQHLQFSGLSTCGSQDCPVCAAKILSRRAQEIMHACEEWRNEGCFVYLLTLTVSHSMGDDLKDVRRGMSAAYSAMWKGRKGVELTRAIHRIHHIKAVEVTVGQNGYHPHFHALIFVTHELNDEHLKLIREAWCYQVVRELGPSFAPSEMRGVTIEESHNDRYIAKMGLEVSGILSKAGKNGNLTMWQVAERAAAGDKWARRTWLAYVQAMHGCRRQIWSQGAKRYFGIQHLSDLQIAEAPIGEKVGPLYVEAIWRGREWDRLSRSHDYWVTRVVHAASGGARALVELPRQLAWDELGHVVEIREPLSPIPCRRGTSDPVSVVGLDKLSSRRAQLTKVPLSIRLAIDDSESAWFVSVRRSGGRPGPVVRLWKRHGSPEQAAIDYATHWRTKPGEWLCSVHQGLFGKAELVTVYRTEGRCVVKKKKTNGRFSSACP